MPRILVKDLRAGDVVDQVFIIRDCQFNTTKTGQPFSKITLSDASGSMPAIYWDTPDSARACLQTGRFVAVKGVVNTYNNAPQVSIQSVSPAAPETVDTADFLPVSENDIPAMWKRLKTVLSMVENRHLVELIRAIVTDKDFSEKFKRAPAAAGMHHAYIGGLLEHTLSMEEAAVKICEHYKALNRDLLLVAILIHDIGKVDEFSYQTMIEYSDRGRLLGHVAIGLEFIDTKAASVPGFPQPLLDVLRHYILSHHGIPEFGAIKFPMTAEAVALHYIDNLDAKLAAFHKATSEHPVAADNWTSYQKMFEGYLYRGSINALGEPEPAGDAGKGAAPDSSLF